jgi:hypothetical protein
MWFPQTKEIKDEIRNAIGVPVDFILQGQPFACSGCAVSGLYDSINETSLNSFCPICSGKYWITEDDTLTITAHVRWKSGDQPDRTIGGETMDGDCWITVSSTDLTNDQVSAIKEIQVDKKQLEVYQTVYRGVPTRDRIRFTCRENSKVI